MALCFLISVNPPRVHAAAQVLNPSNFDITTTYVGTDKYMTLKIPLDQGNVVWNLCDSYGQQISADYGTSFEFEINRGDGYIIYWMLYYLDISDFPDETILEFDIRVDCFTTQYVPEDNTAAKLTPIVRFYNKDLTQHSSLNTVPVHPVNFNGYTNCTTAIFKKTDLAAIGCKLEGFSTDDFVRDTQVVIGLESLKLSFSYSALIEFTENQNKTNGLLNELVYADPEILSMIQAYRDKVNGLGHKVDGMTGTLSPGDIGKLVVDDFDIETLLPNGFTPILSTMSAFASNDIISIMLTLTALCAVIGYLFFGKKG